MTKNYRCVKCELVWDQKDLSFNQFCETCNQLCPNNNERRRFAGIFDFYCAELFYLRYPEPNHSAVSIPSGKEDKKNLLKEIRRKISIKVAALEEQIARQEKDNETSKDSYKEAVADFEQLKQQLPLIVNLEQKYK